MVEVTPLAVDKRDRDTLSNTGQCIPDTHMMHLKPVLHSQNIYVQNKLRHTLVLLPNEVTDRHAHILEGDVRLP